MSTEPEPDEIWRTSLRRELGHLRHLEGEGRGGAEAITKTRRRIERIWSRGLPEWKARGLPGRLP